MAEFFRKSRDFAPIYAPACVFLGQRTHGTFSSKNASPSRSRVKLAAFFELGGE
jgi:hypothetical protein